jgi:hypothetical protein
VNKEWIAASEAQRSVELGLVVFAIMGQSQEKCAAVFGGESIDHHYAEIRQGSV